MNGKKRLLAWALTALVALSLSGCKEEIETVPELLPAAGVASDIFEVRRGENHVLKSIDASVAAYVEELYLTVNGTVDEVLVQPGDRVKAGDLLISLNLDSIRRQADELERQIQYDETVNDFDNRIAETEIKILEAEYASLLSENADEKTLALKSLEIEQAQLNLSQSLELQAFALKDRRAELTRLNKELETDGVYAPFDGVIARKVELDKGSRVTAYDTLVYLADPERIHLVSDYVSEGTLTKANGGYYAIIGDDRYEIKSNPIDNKEFTSRLLSGQQVYTTYEILGPDGWQNRVEAGLFASIILVNSYQPDALLIPANAVLSDSGGKYVYVVAEDGGHEKRDIRVNTPGNSIYSVVLEGLEEGERIYVTDK